MRGLDPGLKGEMTHCPNTILGFKLDMVYAPNFTVRLVPKRIADLCPDCRILVE